MTIRKTTAFLIILLQLCQFFTGCTTVPKSAKGSESSEDTPPPTVVIEPPPQLNFSCKSVAQGDFFVIHLENVKENDELTISTKLLENKPVFSPYLSGKTALIPVSYWTEPGEYPLIVKILRDGQTLLEEENTIVVESKKFSTQYLNVTASQESQRSDNLSQQDEVYVSKAKSVSADTALWEDSFIIPVEGRISTEYGLTRYINNVISGRHAGIDIAAAKGTPVKAANSGIVNLARRQNVTGNTIIIDHGMSVYSGYCHMDRLLVKEGDKVKKGDIIGEVGTTGFSTGPHLHFTVSFGRIFVNPWLLMEEDPFAWIIENHEVQKNQGKQQTQ